MSAHVGYTILELVSGTDYAPTWVSTSNILGQTEAAKRNGPGYYNTTPIFKVLILDNDYSGNIDIWALGDTTPTTIPKASLIIGQEYELYLKKFDATGIRLLGYKPRYIPSDVD